MAAACANLVVEGHFRCGQLDRIFVADRCTDTFHQMRDTARNDRAQRALRLLLAGFAAAAACEDVNDTFIRANAVLQAKPSG